MGERTERETVFANPDGATFTMEKSIAPVRVEKSDGGWVDPDATLIERADGSIGPKAATVDLSFSSGGDGADLVTIGEDGRSLTLGWPGPLPAPHLEGPRAVYDDVLPGVNLILTATVEGFRQVLEVETPEAAANPALDSITYDLNAKGLTLRAGPGGGMEAVDGDGKTLFRSPVAQMWNSAGNSTTATAATGAKLLTTPAGDSVTPAADPVPAGPEEEGDPLAGPGAGDESAVLDLAVGNGSVTVTPDADLMAATTNSEFPLYIDPSVDPNESERTVLSSDGDRFYNFDAGANGMSVGKCGQAVIGGYLYTCGNGYVNRMYFEFAPTGLAGKHILSATFSVTETWSFSCDARWVDLERTNNISSTTKWPGPTKLDQMGDRYVSAGRGGNCSPSQPRAQINFKDNPEETDENLTPTVKSFAAGNISRLTLMLMAKDESDPIAWKRFDDDAVLSIDYIGTPAAPTNLGVDSARRMTSPDGVVPPPSQSCATKESAPAVKSSPAVTLTATPRTATGGEKEAKLRIYFDVDQKSGSTWTDTPALDGSLYPSSGTVGSGVEIPMRWSGLKDGTLYRYQAWTWAYSGNTHLLTSTPAGFCYFKVDTTAPKPPTVKINAPYTECAAVCDPHGAPGVKATFTVGPGAGDTNAKYQYRLSTDPAGTWSDPVNGNTLTIGVIPTVSGENIFAVRAMDYNGWGDETTFSFKVGHGADAIGNWNFLEPGGPALDTSPSQLAGQHSATLQGGAVRTDKGRRGDVSFLEPDGSVGRGDKGLQLDGATGYAATAGQMLSTDTSFTVAGWVRLEGTARNYSVISQNGVNRSPFSLGFDGTAKKWIFRAVNTDAQATGTWSYAAASSLHPAVPQVWTHLAGVFDAGDPADSRSPSLSLYVNGVLQSSVPYTTAWAAKGPLQIGRMQWSGTYTDYFPGVIDEVSVWQDARSKDQIASDATPLDESGKPFVELVADWKPAATTGTKIPDSSDSRYGPELTLTSGVSLAPEGETPEELVLNGTNGAGTAPGPLVDDSGSFTVTTEATVDSAKIAAHLAPYRAPILGQRAEAGSSWSLWFEKTGTDTPPVLDDDGQPVLDDDGNFMTKTVQIGRWHFGRLAADGASTVSVVSDETAVLDSPVRLTGVFDAETQTISLYLGANAMGDGNTAYTVAIGSGNVEVGKGAWGNFLPGRISDIRIWAGAMRDEDQVERTVGS
ncbi:LamG domain-containing protein (plasmid) [Streptomyces sp. NBC_01220]|uniref:LamG-like jellyroll fold domain-containing protein n=1 Tax=Streptomyces sp. NBC_01220 TaxID=2903781 RepID=UPI00352D45D4|nr:LamG domain-containing protein [Streptomyces sp. NBC_01220]